MTFPLTITTIGEVLFHGDAESLIAPGADGELTVLPNHVPLATRLKEGRLKVRTREQVHEFSVSRGILEVSRKNVTVLL